MTRIGGDAAAHGAQSAAQAQERSSKRSYNQLKGRLGAATQLVNDTTVSGLMQFDKDISNQERNLSRQEQLIAQLDPTIIEASQQALRLLRGEQSSTLAPLKNQRDMQRQKLVNSLRAQMGPGAETSTAGIQALTRFDAETDNIFAGAQQQAISNLGQVGSQFNSQRPDIQREIMGLSALGQGKTALGYQQAGMWNQQANTLFAARQPVTQLAGAKYTAETLRGQEQQKAGFMAAESGFSMLGAAGGAKAPAG